MTMAVFFGIYGVIAGRLVYLGMQDPEDSGPPGNARDRVAPRHRRPQRRGAGDRHQDVVAVCRAAPHRRRRRGDREAVDRAARSRRRADLPQAEERHRLRLAEAPTVAEAAERHHEARHSRHRLPHREAPLLSRRRDRVAHRRPDQHRQPGHCRHGEIHRRRRALPISRRPAWRSPTDLQPVKLSIDLRVQHIVRDEIVTAMERYHAIAAGAVVLNVKTGEVVAMASVPDFDPNNPFNAQDKDRLNRMSAGLYEMGSTFKSFTTAMALDSGKVTLESTLRRVAPDHHRPPDHPRLPRQGPRADRAGGVHLLLEHRLGAARPTWSASRATANSCTAWACSTACRPNCRRSPTPTEPKVWKKVNSITIAFGHGVSTTPLQTAVGCAALMNGGYLIQPTFLPRTRGGGDGGGQAGGQRKDQSRACAISTG